MTTPRNQVNVHLSDKHHSQLADMAREAGERPSKLAKKLLEALLDDDARAHAPAKDRAA